MLSILFFLLVVTIILALFYGALLGTLWSEAPFVPTGRRDLRWMIEVAAIKPGEVVYDLGSGDGRIVRAAAKLGARAVGYEKSLPLIWWSRLLVLFSNARHGPGTEPPPDLRQTRVGAPRASEQDSSRRAPARADSTISEKSSEIVSALREGSPQACRRLSSAPNTQFGNAHFKCADYFREDLRDADVIFCYLMPKAMEHLKAKFEKELRPGTRIISRAFSIPGWQARQNLTAADKNLGGQAQVFRFSKRSPPVYLYKVH